MHRGYLNYLDIYLYINHSLGSGLGLNRNWPVKVLYANLLPHVLLNIGLLANIGALKDSRIRQLGNELAVDCLNRFPIQTDICHLSKALLLSQV
jgi:hypothetical protein